MVTVKACSWPKLVIREELRVLRRHLVAGVPGIVDLLSLDRWGLKARWCLRARSRLQQVFPSCLLVASRS